LALAVALPGAVPLPATAKLAPLPGSSAGPDDARILDRTVPLRARAESGDWGGVVVRGGPLSPVMVESGVLFRYRDRDADRVTVVGDFNGWDELATPLRRCREGLWRTTVELDEGPWPYLYVVDGVWTRDPDNPIVDVQDAAVSDLASQEEASFLVIRHGEIIRPRPPGFREGHWNVDGQYNRVDQLALGSSLTYENRAELHPEVSLGAGWSFGRDRLLYDVSVTQPLFSARGLDVGARAYRVTATPDEHRMGDTENSLATFFFREDWRDYHEAEGVQAHATLHLGRVVDLTGTWTGEDHRSLGKTTDWGLFGGEKRMRANPAVDEGTLRTLAVTTTLDTRNSRRNPSRGLLVRASHEWAGDELGGDFEFRRTTADFRRYLKLSRRHYFDLRLTGGLIEGAHRGGVGGERNGFDAIPVQERFYLGGVGTLRATQFKSLTGDRYALGNAELRIEVFRNLLVATFVDVGDAWVSADGDLDVKTDAGIGFQDSDSNFRLNIAKKIDGRPDDDGLFVSARIRRMF
ncbi:MAG TPA: BamA/TamA family outer membrane protein, partial [bacterium]|nr:BamA/TamA family outer membrane protein [bacterium]